MLDTSESCTLPARPEALEQLHVLLERFWDAVEGRRGRGTPRALRLGFTTAVLEIAANIIRYAGVATFDLVLTHVGRSVIEARFRDTGSAFVREATVEKHTAPSRDDVGTLAEGGRGLALAARSLRTLDYRRLPDRTNSWILVQRIPG